MLSNFVQLQFHFHFRLHFVMTHRVKIWRKKAMTVKHFLFWAIVCNRDFMEKILQCSVYTPTTNKHKHIEFISFCTLWFNSLQKLNWGRKRKSFKNSHRSKIIGRGQLFLQIIIQHFHGIRNFVILEKKAIKLS